MIAVAPPPTDEEAAALIIIAIIGIIALIAFLIPAIFYCLSLQRALERCAPDNRRMIPGLVWLNMIPLVANVWIFITVCKLAESLRNEYASRGLQSEGGGYGFGVGIAMGVLALLAIIPYVGIVAAIGYLVCWIIHWVTISSCSRKIEEVDRSLQTPSTPQT